MKVEVDRDVCAASGVCMMIAPDVFEPDDEGYARVFGDADIGGGRGCRPASRAELSVGRDSGSGIRHSGPSGALTARKSSTTVRMYASLHTVGKGSG